MPRKRKTEKPLTLEERAGWEAFSDDIEGIAEPMDPQDINVAREVEESIRLFGDEAVPYAEYRVECAFFEDDKEDWKDVVRIIRERQAEMAKK